MNKLLAYFCILTSFYTVSVSGYSAGTCVQISRSTPKKPPAQLSEDKKLLDQKDASSQTRAVCSDPIAAGSSKNATTQMILANSQVAFNKALYLNDGNALLLSADKLGAEKKNLILARTIVSQDEPIIIPMAPDKVTLNQSSEQDNPLLAEDAVINNLADMHSFPVCTVTAKDTEATTVYLINGANGLAMFKNDDPIADAAGTAIDKSIVGLEASRSAIFAMVPAAGKNFSDNDGIDRGVSIVKAENTKLVPAQKAVKLDAMAYNLTNTSATVNLAFYDNADTVGNNAITHAQLGEKVAMYWDDKLKRLFIGLEARRDSASELNKAGGILNIAVGRFDKANASAPVADVFKISSIVESPSKALFYDTSAVSDPNKKNVIDRVVGFYFDSSSNPPDAKIPFNTDVVLATEMIRTMHTSTGKDYLITLGRMSDGVTTVREVYALPLQGVAANPDDTTPQKVGTLAKRDFSGPPLTIDDMPLNTDVRVGGQSGSLSDSVNVTDIFVQGDAVYICLAGLTQPVGAATTQSNQVGIFQSNALFDATGFINGWTPFTRVMGSVARVYGGGLNAKTGSYLFLTETNEADISKPFFDPNNPNVYADNISTVCKTRWGLTNSVNNLSGLLASLFPFESLSVHQVNNFDEKTPGFSQDGGNDHISVMGAIGYDSVALIQSGKTVGASNLFMPETKFFVNGPNQNVFLFDRDPALKKAAPLFYSELARSEEPNEGWFFVAGCDSVVVLRKANGQGFDSGAGLENLSLIDFPGSGYSFKELVPTSSTTSFLNLRKIMCLNRVLYIVGKDKIYAVDLEGAAEKFADVPTMNLDEQSIDLTGLPKNAALIDFIPLAGSALPTSPEFNNFRALLGTTKGLYIITRDALGNSITREVLIDGASIGGPVIQLQYLSRTKGVPSAQGNLYLVSSNPFALTKKALFLRFDVNANLTDQFVFPIQHNQGLVAFYNDFRPNFFVDGSTLIHTRGKHFGNTDYMVAQARSELSNDINVPLTSQLLLTSANKYVGVLGRESASGALYIPGDWGLRANL